MSTATRSLALISASVLPLPASHAQTTQPARLPAVELVKVTASDAEVGDNFGSAVSVSADRALVGAYFDDNNAKKDSGSVYVLERDSSGAWVEAAKLVQSDGARWLWDLALDFGRPRPHRCALRRLGLGIRVRLRKRR